MDETGVKQAKFYAFLLDCTRDVRRVEQMSIILRFCNSSTGAIEEHFVGFIAFAETTGEYITNSILQELERNGLDIQNCREQRYDNGTNIIGTILREGENSDIPPFELNEELQLLKTNSLDSINDAKQLIQYILENNLEEIYPNVYVTIRIMLTVPSVQLPLREASQS
ncbi:zinc finger MYM-type protein 1 [Trichonephila clavipes]|nr:zinc finger MYM-type protein 1 [Trichonephila clavipes]